MPYNSNRISEEPKHSGIGIASFIMCIVAFVSIFVVVIIAGVLEESTPGGLSETSPQAMIIGLLVILFALLDLIALVLGIVGLAQRNRKKLFAILGTLFSSITIIGSVGLFILGSTP